MQKFYIKPLSGILSFKNGFLFLVLLLFSQFLFAQPKINYFYPASGTTGTTVNIVGKNLTGAQSVSFDHSPASSFTVVDDTLILAVAGIGYTGTITVITPAGYDSTIQVFTFNQMLPAPIIKSFSPQSGTTGTHVTIYGQGLVNATAVSFGGISATSFTVADTPNVDTFIVAIVGSGATGKIKISNAGGADSLGTFTFIPPPPPPIINSFLPTSGGTGTTLTIKGKNFTGANNISVGSIKVASYTVLNDSTITALVGAGNTGAVSVTTPIGNDTLGTFTFVTSGAPIINYFTPVSGNAGTSVSIVGKNFEGTTGISFGEIAASSFSVINDTLITAIVGTGATGSILVTSGKGSGDIPGFTYTGPLVTLFFPGSAGPGATVTIKGLHFTGTTAVSFGGIAASSFVVVSDSVITAIVASGSSGAISIITSLGTASLNGFVFVPPVPVIFSFTPTTGIAGTSINIKGKNFTGVSSVSFGGTTAQSFTILSDSVIAAIVGVGNSGNVGVINSYGSGTLAGFIFIPATKINSFTPTSAGAGQTITIRGISFTQATSVDFGGMPAVSFIVISDTVITAIVANGSTGSVDVNSPQGASSLLGFKFLPLAKINSFTPSSTGPGQNITITGFSFTSATSVSFGGVYAASFIIVSDTVINAIVSNGTSGDVVINTPQGNTSLAGYHFLAAPIITSFNPAAGTIGTVVNISGAGFDSIAANNIVFFGAVKANVISASANSIVVSVPAGASYQLISVSVNGLTAYSAQPFNVTFPNGGAITINSFAPEKKFGVGYNTKGIAIGDLDGDGKPDVVTTNQGYNTISLLRNISTIDSINFIQRKQLITLQNPNGISINDLNGDGKPDLIGLTTGEVYLERSASSVNNFNFPGLVYYTMPNVNDGVCIGDLDGDGRPDMAMANNGANVVSVFRNATMNGTISYLPKIDFPTGKNPSSVSINDLDGDGKPDLIVANSDDSSISIYKNTSIAGAISFTTKINFTTGVNPIAVTNADIDGDGKPDIIVLNQKDGTTSVFLNKSSIGTISFASKVDFPIGSIGVALTVPNIAIGDLDGDGKPDLAFAIADGSLNGAIVLKNLSVPGVVSFTPKIDFATASKGATNVAINDIDGDGKPELLVVNGIDDTTVSIFRNIMNNPLQPFIISFTPDSGFTDTTVMIIGKNFAGATTVSFGGVPAASFTIINDSTITAVVGSGATGNVSITTPNGTAALAGFIFIQTKQPPVINSFTPDSANQGTPVIINGKNFTGATTVSFGGIEASSFVVENDSTIVTTVGTGATGSVSITTPNGTATLPGFVFIDQPIDSSFVLIQFAGNTIGSSILVQWQTLNDENISVYTLQKSADSISFSNIDSVNANKINGVFNDYSFTDSFPQYQVNYYRLLITDILGNIKYSNIIKLDLSADPQSVKIFPNPAQGSVTVQHPSVNGSSQIELVDMNGRVVKIVSIGQQVAQNSIDLSGIIARLYRIVWTDGTNTMSQSLIIK